MEQDEFRQNLALKAAQIARALRHAPETRRRLAPTERMWQYRSYQGSDSIGMVDWRQSARMQAPVVREHEQLRTQTTYIWAERKSEKALLALLSLAFLLTYKERHVGWLGGTRPATATTSQVPHMIPAKEDVGLYPVAKPLRHAFLVVAADFYGPAAGMIEVLRHYIVQGNRLVLVHTGTHPMDHFHNWPVITFSKDDAADGFAAMLLAKTLQETR